MSVQPSRGRYPIFLHPFILPCRAQNSILSLAAEIGGKEPALEEDRVDGLVDTSGLLGMSQVRQEQGCRSNGGDRVGDTLTLDVRSGAVNAIQGKSDQVEDRSVVTAQRLDSRFSHSEAVSGIQRRDESERTDQGSGTITDDRDYFSFNNDFRVLRG
jgi:hypothetical protein